MNKKSLVLCTLTAFALMAFVYGCSKKTAEQAESTETTSEATDVATMGSPLAGTYAADLMGGTAKVALSLNADNTAMMSMEMTGQPAKVQNGTWAMGAAANMVDVTFTGQVGDSTMAMTMNFAASSAGDTLALQNGAAMGMPEMALVKQPAAEAGHEGHSH